MYIDKVYVLKFICGCGFDGVSDKMFIGIDVLGKDLCVVGVCIDNG